MVTTFDSVTLPNASKSMPKYNTLTSSTLLVSGKNAVDTSDEANLGIVITGIGTLAEVMAIVAKIGAVGSLVTEWETYANCAISGSLDIEESENPSHFKYRVAFVQDTSI